MTILTEKRMPNGTCRVTVELKPGETLLTLRPNAHYQLGQPLDEVVASHILSEAVEVTWCSVSQKWVG